MAQEEAEKRAERAQQRAAEEKRLKELRQKFAEEQAKVKDIKKEVMSIEAAREEVQLLEAKISNATSLIVPTKERALKQLKEHYEILLKELKNKTLSPKDQFETNEDYKARIKKHQEEIRILQEKYETEYQAIENKFENEIASVTKAFRDRIEELKSRKYPVEGLRVELFKYYPEQGLYRVILIDTKGYLWFYSLMVKSDVARKLFERKESLKAEGYYLSIYNTKSLREAYIIDQIAEKRYQCIIRSCPTTDSVLVRPLNPIQSSTDSSRYPDIAHLNNTTHFYYLEKKKTHLRGYNGIFRCWMTEAVYLSKNGSIYLSGKDHFS